MVAPKKYWDLYERFQFASPVRRERPEGTPCYRHQPSWEIRNGSYRDVPLMSEEGTVPDNIEFKGPTATKLA